MVGQVLGHFGVGERLGAGGMGVVYRARDTWLERDVAIKVLPAATLADDAARGRFRKEALALARLNHSNIGTVFDFNSEHGVDFLVMELVVGESLEDAIARGPLAERDVVALGIQIASALEEAHERRIIHCSPGRRCAGTASSFVGCVPNGFLATCAACHFVPHSSTPLSSWTPLASSIQESHE
jgi:hypothetical protein